MASRQAQLLKSNCITQKAPAVFNIQLESRSWDRGWGEGIVLREGRDGTRGGAGGKGAVEAQQAGQTTAHMYTHWQVTAAL